MTNGFIRNIHVIDQTSRIDQLPALTATQLIDCLHKLQVAVVLAIRLDLMESAVLNMQSADNIRDLIQTISTKDKSSKKSINGLEH